jgi:hypothetical protein
MDQSQDSSHNPGKTSMQIVRVQHASYEPVHLDSEEIQSKFKNLMAPGNGHPFH